MFDAKNTVEDSLGDNFNNKVGAGIAKYAKENNLPEEALPILVKDALDRGPLAVSEIKDPRVNWHETLAGKPYNALFDGPSKGVAQILGRRYGHKGLKSGCLSGPGKPLEWIDVSDEQAMPKFKPGASEGAVPPSGPGSVGKGDRAKLSADIFTNKRGKQPPVSVQSQRGASMSVVRATENQNVDARIAENPFDMQNQGLKLQATMLKRNPGLAERLILSAGRDPRMFGL